MRKNDFSFQKLYQFVEETKFDRLGVFMYSKEDGTPAERLSNQIHGNTKKARFNQIMKLQQTISSQNLEKTLGKEVEVLIENVTFDQKYWIGRTKMDVPEIDGVVYIQNTSQKNLRNQFVKCRIVDRREYDLLAEINNIKNTVKNEDGINSMCILNDNMIISGGDSRNEIKIWKK